jgi:hypothetical protein
MIAQIIKLCQMLPYYGGGEHIEIAKGKHAIVKDLIKFKEQVKRTYKAKR